MIARSENKWWEGFRNGLAEQSRKLETSSPPEVGNATYSVVGDIERVDQRDTILARYILKPGTPEYEKYYAQHPHHKQWDDENRRSNARSTEHNFKSDPLGVQFQPALWGTRRMFAMPEAIQGREERDSPLWDSMGVDASKVSPEELTFRMKGFAEFLGATKVRVTTPKMEWLYTHHGYLCPPEMYGKPMDFDHKYIICLAMRQNRFPISEGNGYGACLEVGWRYNLISLVTVTLANVIRSWGFRTLALTPEVFPFMVVPTFIDAGMGEQGRMGITVSKEFGNNFRPGIVATDMPLVADKPVDFGLQDFCDKCRVCYDACPVRAIPKDRKKVRGVYRWQMDPKKCRGYWSKMGHSCSICQASCPWNFDSTPFHNTMRTLTQKIPIFRKPAIWGYKLFYEKAPWKPTPTWASGYGN